MNKTGFIIINKPSGITSHDVIYKLRRITGVKKIGHAGTLDPIATGVLICAIGREATREISNFVKMDKEYVAEIIFGASSDTYDREGVVVEKKDCVIPTLEQVKELLKQFQGRQKQTPPMFSAKKVGGKKLYQLARKGITIPREPVEVEISEIKLLNYEWPFAKIQLKCSSGTYVRSLIQDIGERLGCGAYMKELERITIGEFIIKNACRLDDLSPDNWEKNLLEHKTAEAAA